MSNSQPLDSQSELEASSPSSGNVFCFKLEEFPELSWVLHYTSTQARLQRTIAALSEEIAILDREQPIDGGHIEQYEVTKNGKTYSYYRYRWYVGLTKAGNPKLKQKHLTARLKTQYERRMAIGTQKRLLEQQRRKLQAQSEALQQEVREMQWIVKHFSFPNSATIGDYQETQP